MDDTSDNPNLSKPNKITHAESAARWSADEANKAGDATGNGGDGDDAGHGGAGDVSSDTLSARQLAAVGRQIRKYRVQRGFSQMSFALAIGLRHSYYGALERGEHNFGVLNLIKIAEGLGVEVGALFPPLKHLTQEPSAGVVAGAVLDTTGIDEAPQKLKPGPKAGASKQTPVGRYGVAGDKGSWEEIELEERKVDLVSAGAAAKMLGVSRRTITRWAASGVLPAYFVEDNRGEVTSVFRREHILQYAEAHHKKRPEQRR